MLNQFGTYCILKNCILKILQMIRRFVMLTDQIETNFEIPNTFTNLLVVFSNKLTVNIQHNC